MVREDTVNMFKYLRESVIRYSDEFQRYIRKVIEALGDTCSIVLFGSRARGDNMESSDFDVAIIVKDELSTFDVLDKVVVIERGCVPVDLVVLKISDLERGVIRKMLMKCKILYDGLNLRDKLESLCSCEVFEL